MTEQDKPKLTLNTNKLSFNKGPKVPFTPASKTLSSKTQNVTIQVKTKTLSNNGVKSDSSRLNQDDFSRKLNLVRRAAEESSRVIKKEDNNLIGTLSHFGNHSLPSVVEENIISSVVEDAPKSQEHSIKVEVKENSTDNAPINLKKHSHVKQDKDEVADSDFKNIPNKFKQDDGKKFNKHNLYHMLDDDSDTPMRSRSLASIKRAREKEKRKMQENQPQEKIYREVILPEMISVGDLASRMSERVVDVIKELMKLGIIANSNQMIDADTAEIVIHTFGHSIKRIQESDVENILTFSDEPEDLVERSPVVTVMGHVDHGKTSLLDALRMTDVAAGESGGITQHIGAYSVHLQNGRHITFIDTPGHEAFTEMRTRGAKVTDIVILVVAADDGIKAQTIEAISHAKAAEVPIIVAINKIDKNGANIEKVNQELLQHELIHEDLGGDIITVPVSALKKQNLDKLEEAVLLVAEMLELKSNPNTAAHGSVIESRIDKGLGAVSTILVQRGTLKIGDILVAGTAYGRVKGMMNDKGVNIALAGPSDPVEVFGLNLAPMAGDLFSVVQSDKQARDIAEYREQKAQKKRNSVVKANLDERFLRASGSSKIKDLGVIIKGDVQGSVEALLNAINKLDHQEIKVKVLHHAVGAINESDIRLAEATNALVVGFNVRASGVIASLVEKLEIDLRYYSIIYNVIDDIKSMMSGMLSPIIREEYIGSVEIRQVFNITKVGKIAGSYVTKGIIKRGAGVRLLRDDVVIHEGKLKTLRRFKDDVKEVREGYECGIAFENYGDIRESDKVEVFEIIEEKRKL